MRVMIAFKEKDPKTYENYKDNLERFAYRKLREGQMDEKLCDPVSGIPLFDPVSAEDGVANRSEDVYLSSVL